MVCCEKLRKLGRKESELLRRAKKKMGCTDEWEGRCCQSMERNVKRRESSEGRGIKKDYIVPFNPFTFDF